MGWFSNLFSSPNERARELGRVLRARTYAARPGAPGRSEALQRLRATVVDGERQLQDLQDEERAGNLRGTILMQVEREMAAARARLLESNVRLPSSGHAPDSQGSAQFLREFGLNVRALDRLTREGDAIVRRYDRSRDRGQTAAYSNQAVERRAADSVGPVLYHMNAVRDAVEQNIAEWPRRRGAMSLEQQRQGSQLAQQGTTLARRSDTIMASWMGYSASQFDTVNQDVFQQLNRRGLNLTLRGVHSIRDLQARIDRELGGGLKWYHWALGGLAIFTAGYVVVKIGIVVGKLTPQYRVAATVAGTAKQRPRR